MEYLHGLRKANEQVKNLWRQSIEDTKKYSHMVAELREKRNGFDYCSADYNELCRQIDRLHNEWSEQIGRSDMCGRIYDAISALISEEINPKEVAV